MAHFTAEDISRLTSKLVDSQDRVIELERTLHTIAWLWPDPEHCGDLCVNGINDGKARLITAHAAVNAARKALGLSLHKFPGEAA